MQVLTAKELQGFELEVARHLAKLPIAGYTLLGFKFFNQELFEIKGLIISDEGIVCCLEISDRDGIWLGSTDGIWTTDVGEISCNLANNPWKQVNYYILFIKNLLWAKLNKSTFVDGLIIVPNEAQIRIANIAIDNFNRNNPIAICHLSKLEMLFNQMQSLFKLPYEQGRAGKWIYALTGITEAGLLENSKAIAPSIIQVRQDVQRSITHNTDLTEQILSELIEFNSNMQKIFSENTDLIERFLVELIEFKQDINSQTVDLAGRLVEELNRLKQEIKDQNNYLVGRLFTEVGKLQQEIQNHNSDMVKQYSQERVQLKEQMAQFQQEIQNQNNSLRTEISKDLDSFKRIIQQDLQRLTEQNSTIVTQSKKIESILTEPKGWQKFWQIFKGKKKR